MIPIDFPILSWLLWLPLAGALAVWLVPRDRPMLARHLTMLVALAGLLVALMIFAAFDPSVKQPQFVERFFWIEPWGVSYYLGVDGISLLLVFLTSFLAPIVILSTYGAVSENVRGYMFSLQLLQVGMLGAFLALDIFFFYVFWELMLIPMVFIIGIWGGPRRVYAAVKFFLFTLAGSVLMLVALIAVVFAHYAQTGVLTTDLFVLYHTSYGLSAELWLFAAFALAFAIKVPMFPLHTWLPDAHVEAPTAGSVVLAAVLLKMGTYGFMRFAYPLFPKAAMVATPVIAVLAVIGILYGAMVALAQTDIKKLIAYSSVSHLGYVMLGVVSLTAAGVSGGMLQMVNHGITTGMLFLLVGVIYERRHTREISEFGGLASRQPLYAVLFLVATLGSIGLPGTNGFVGEFLVMLGTFQSSWLGDMFHSFAAPWALTALAGLGVILGAVYMLWMVQRVFFGPLSNEKNRLLSDLSGRELLVLVPLLMAIFGIGFFPSPLLVKIEPAVKAYIEDIQSRAAAPDKPAASAAGSVRPDGPQTAPDHFALIHPGRGGVR